MSVIVPFGSPRVIRLSVAAAAGFVLLGAMAWVAGTLWDQADRIAQLREADRTASAAAARAATAGSGLLLPHGLDCGLLALDKESAIALIQRTLQESVAPPAKLENFHSLDVATGQGLDSVRASIRLRDVPPEQVVALIHRIESTRPAIVFDDIRVSVQTRPGPLGVSGPGAAALTTHAEVAGTVRVFIRRPAGTADGRAP